MNISTTKNCYGCMACMSVCPKECIKLDYGRLGHIIPVVDENLCIDCGTCVKVCQDYNPINLNIVDKVYACWSKDEDVWSHSSSGGIATELSMKFVENGGVVYGCRFDKPLQYHHVRCATLATVLSLRGSKYLQSDITGVYEQINSDLKNGRKILFFGTPCQVAGVKGRFDSRENLYTVDLLCHGTPSSRIFMESLPQWLMDANPDMVMQRESSSYQVTAYIDGNRIYYVPLKKSLYLKGFFMSLFNRDSCYKCPYAQKGRVGDLTLGDFWGCDAKVTKENANKGVSLCMQNTQKGYELIKMLDNRIFIKERPIEEAMRGNAPLNAPCKRTLFSNIFNVLYPVLGFKWSVRLSIPHVLIKNLLK